MERRLRKMLAAVSAAGMCFSFAVGAYGAWQVSGDTDNILTMAVYQNKIVEEYEIPDHVDPGLTVNKVVNVKNTGKVDSMIRVAVTKQFGSKGENGSFEIDETLDPEMILIDYNTDCWMERDGYFYYKNILKAGTITKEPLFSSYTLSPEAGNAYKGKEAQIIINMESVQAEGNAVGIWGITETDLGITVPPAPKTQDTGVTYYGKTDGFDISTGKTDLFANFKNLMPGCGRMQRIAVKNQSSEKTELFVHAEAAEQEKMNLQQLALLHQLLNRYACIELTMNGMVLYQGPVSGKAAAGESSMSTDISLGNYEAGETKQLTVKLSLSPEMDQKFEKLTGKVKWVFTAGGEDAAEPPQTPANTITPAKTGVNEKVAESMAAFVGFLFLGCISYAGGRRKGKNCP